MDREISTATNIAVAVIAMAALLSIVMFTVYVGNQVKNDAIEQAVAIQESISSGVFESLLYKDSEMPTAAAYGLLQIGIDVLTESNCKVCGKTLGPGKVGSCLQSHLTGRVSLEVIKVSDGQYKVVIHDEDCTWATTVCNE